MPSAEFRDTNKMTQAISQRVRRRREAAQSLTVAISVLFLLLFLGGIFIAIVINNLRAGRTNAKQTASSRFALAGLEYLDRQLSESPEGADWRPRPDFANGAIDPNDPDFDWLRPCNDPSIDPLADPAEPCGYTRVNFGGDDPTVGNLGGRALVRVSYLPYRPLTGGQPGDLWDDVNRDGTFNGVQERICRSGENPAPGACIAADPTRKYIKLEAVGRAGIIVTADPTTYARSQGKSLLYERVGYKSIGLNEYVRYITNKDGSPVTANLGAILQVKDAPAGANSTTRPIDTTQPELVEPRLRDIASVYYGPIRSNTSLQFHGPNYLFLDPRRNDALEVAGLISLANVPDGAIALPNTPQEPANDAQELQAQTNPGRVWVTDIGGTGSLPPPANPNVFPSGSAVFSLLNGLVRDNAAGVGTPGANLRHVARQSVPLIDLSRYRSITQGAERMANIHTGPNPVGAFPDPNFAGTIGWGANLYIGNAGEVNRPSNALIDAYSPRADWLTPGGTSNWQTGFKYEPPGVTITFTPRFMILERTATRPTDPQQRPFAFRDPVSGDRLTNAQTIIRYTDLAGGPGAPTAGIATGTPTYAGYPATAVSPNVFQGDFTVFAEGNVRVRGVIGGRDPETARYFLRHLTVVSGGTIYVDGSLLRDNLIDDASADAARVRGRSTIALLAKEYVTVNTTQFLKPGDTRLAPATIAPQEGPAQLSALPGALDNFTYQFMNVPVDVYDANGRMTNLLVPDYAVPASGAQRLFVRQSSVDPAPDGANVIPTMNQSLVGGLIQDNPILPVPPFPPPGTFQVVGDGASGIWLNSVFPLPVAALFPTNAVPFASPSVTGMENKGKILYDRPNSTSDYLLSRLGVAPLDVRVEALMYAQEGSFFIIPGPWLNANPNDTYQRYMVGDAALGPNPTRRRDGENASTVSRIDPRFPFYNEPQDIRLTFFGAISENLPAEVGDQGAWLEKWGWVPRYQGSTGLPSEPGYPLQQLVAPSVHGPMDPTLLPGPLGRGVGIVYSFDDRLLLPYATDGSPLRFDGFGRVLPAAPRLPVAPGMIYSGERTR
jgi:hypothetical protein